MRVVAILMESSPPTQVQQPATQTQQPVPPAKPFRWLWQIGIAFAGVLTIIVGIVLLPLPGPGSVVIFAGIGILATEFVWAKQLLTRTRIWVKQVARRWKKK